MMQQNLEKKLEELAKQVENVSDTPDNAPLKQSLQMQIDELRTEIKNPPIPKDVAYFSSRSLVPEDLYRIEFVTEISIQQEYKDVNLELKKMPPYINEGDPENWDCWERSGHMIGIKEIIKNEALEIAKRKRYDAVSLGESGLKVETAYFNPRGKDFFEKTKLSDVRYKMSALATFYVLKESGEQNAAKP